MASDVGPGSGVAAAPAPAESCRHRLGRRCRRPARRRPRLAGHDARARGGLPPHRLRARRRGPRARGRRGLQDLYVPRRHASRDAGGRRHLPGPPRVRPPVGASELAGGVRARAGRLAGVPRGRPRSRRRRAADAPGAGDGGWSPAPVPRRRSGPDERLRHAAEVADVAGRPVLRAGPRRRGDRSGNAPGGALGRATGRRRGGTQGHRSIRPQLRPDKRRSSALLPRGGTERGSQGAPRLARRPVGPPGHGRYRRRGSARPRRRRRRADLDDGLPHHSLAAGRRSVGDGTGHRRPPRRASRPSAARDPWRQPRARGRCRGRHLDAQGRDAHRHLARRSRAARSRPARARRPTVSPRSSAPSSSWTSRPDRRFTPVGAGRRARPRWSLAETYAARTGGHRRKCRAARPHRARSSAGRRSHGRRHARGSRACR